MSDMRILLIASGAYGETELEVEFGRIPPSFLPLGNKRLYEHQYAEFGQDKSRILLSVPESFVPDPMDLARLQALGIELIAVPEPLSLGASVVYVINVSAIAGIPLMLLHGDTLLTGITPIAGGGDAVSIETEPQADYLWGGGLLKGEEVQVVLDGEAPAANVVLTGFFSFSDSTRLVQCITHQRGAFLNALRAYGSVNPFRPVHSRAWLDFGHASTYHRSRRRFTTQREFNSLTVTARVVVKSGVKQQKIEAEARWFEQLPEALRLYAPAYLGRRDEHGRVGYALEYMHLPTLSDLFVFGRLRLESWKKILDACDEVLGAMSSYRAPETVRSHSLRDLYLDKTVERLEMYARSTGVDHHAPCRYADEWLPSLMQMAELVASAIPAAGQLDSRLIHGDFCFSNLLFDVRTGVVKMLDPRGLDSTGEFTVWGDPRYDIAKMHHSIVGLYDHIVAGNFKLHLRGQLDVKLELPDDPLTRLIRDEFMQRSFGGLCPTDCSALPISVLLFLSMLPLHADNPERQRAFMANSMRLFQTIDALLG